MSTEDKPKSFYDPDYEKPDIRRFLFSREETAGMEAELLGLSTRTPDPWKQRPFPLK